VEDSFSLLANISVSWEEEDVSMKTSTCVDIATSQENNEIFEFEFEFEFLIYGPMNHVRL
jgi:hypothetical protein